MRGGSDQGVVPDWSDLGSVAYGAVVSIVAANDGQSRLGALWEACRVVGLNQIAPAIIKLSWGSLRYLRSRPTAESGSVIQRRREPRLIMAVEVT